MQNLKGGKASGEDRKTAGSAKDLQKGSSQTSKKPKHTKRILLNYEWGSKKKQSRGENGEFN